MRGTYQDLAPCFGTSRSYISSLPLDTRCNEQLVNVNLHLDINKSQKNYILFYYLYDSLFKKKLVSFSPPCCAPTLMIKLTIITTISIYIYYSIHGVLVFDYLLFCSHYML